MKQLDVQHRQVRVELQRASLMLLLDSRSRNLSPILCSRTPVIPCEICLMPSACALSHDCCAAGGAYNAQLRRFPGCSPGHPAAAVSAVPVSHIFGPRSGAQRGLLTCTLLVCANRMGS